MINDSGELEFLLGPKSGRRISLIFDDCLRAGASAEKPPVASTEPYEQGSMRTQMDDYAEPKVNFLLMQPGEKKEVRLWIVFATTQRSYFYLCYAQIPNQFSGNVMVEAVDMTGDDVTDRWILYPKAGTDNSANLHRRSYTGKNRTPQDLGDYRMPFALVLDRVK